MKFSLVLEEISLYNTHPYLPTKKESIYDRVVGHEDDRYIFKSKNNKFSSKQFGKLDPNQYHSPAETNDVKDYKRAINKNKAYLTKVNKFYKVKI